MNIATGGISSTSTAAFNCQDADAASAEFSIEALHIAHWAIVTSGDPSTLTTAAITGNSSFRGFMLLTSTFRNILSLQPSLDQLAQLMQPEAVREENAQQSQAHYHCGNESQNEG